MAKKDKQETQPKLQINVTPPEKIIGYFERHDVPKILEKVRENSVDAREYYKKHFEHLEG